MVMELVVSRKDECNSAGSGVRAQFVELFPMSMNLIRVSSSKFVPTLGIMSKPIT
jgi:hypothetical protein